MDCSFKKYGQRVLKHAALGQQPYKTDVDRYNLDLACKNCKSIKPWQG